ncbi:MAG: iron export ABC transporter permease subunit FetB [Rhodospirillaceae bacterium]|jgi:putative ABC transport system permease protein
MNFISLTYTDLAIASLLVIGNAVLSLILRLNLEKQFLIAAARTVIQLTLVGLVLKTLFELVSLWLTAFVALLMILFAGYEVLARQKQRFSGFWTYGLGTSSMLASGMIVTIFALTTQLKPDPWFDPRYAIPLLGMILGNTMTGISLGLNTLIGNAVREKVAIEASLALGHDIHKAFGDIVRDAVRTGLIPIINAMSAAGVVSLPGMMTGQILGGVPPVEAVKYQILIMFLIAGGTAIGLISAVYSGAWRLTDKRHRLRLDRLNAAQEQ